MGENLFRCWAYDLIAFVGGCIIVGAFLVESYIVSILLWISYYALMNYYGANYYKYREKPEVTVVYDKENDRMIVLSSDDADKVVKVKTMIIDKNVDCE
jgi:hypothetical protein